MQNAQPESKYPTHFIDRFGITSLDYSALIYYTKKLFLFHKDNAPLAKIELLT